VKNYSVDKIRNIGLFSHGGAGKTTLAEAMLYTSGVTDRMGKTTDGTSFLDYDAEEIKRQMSISTSMAPIEWKGHKINLLDTPGYLDFVGEIMATMRVIDAAVILVDAVSGVEVGTELVWEHAENRQVPRMVVVNRMDRENANYDRALESVKNQFGSRIAPVMIPIGSQADFSGVVDIVHKKAYKYADASGKKITECEIPANMENIVANYRDQLIETAAEADDDLMMVYLEGEEIPDDLLIKALKAGIRTAKFIPVACSAGAKNVGTVQLLDFIIENFPSPADMPAVQATKADSKEVIELPANPSGPLAALVFKTMADPFVGKLTIFKVYSGTMKADTSVWNVNKGRTERITTLFTPRGKKQENVTELVAGDIGSVAKLQDTTTNETLGEKERPLILNPIVFPHPALSSAVEPKSKGDEDKIGSGFSRLAEEDPTFAMHKDPETKQTIIAGLGELHLDVMISRLAKKFGAEVQTVEMKLPYRETIRGKVRVEGRHKKQSGGKGQFGHVWLEMEPKEDGNEFVDKIFGGSVPRQFIPAVEKGLVEILAKGVLAGYPVVNVQVALVDGSYHAVDSSEMAFKLATHVAFKKGFALARPVLLEPIMNIEVTIPDEYMGDIIGDLNKKRGRVMGMEAIGKGRQIVRAQAPQSELFRYATDLRSMTQGRGFFKVAFDHYEEIPTLIAEAIIAAYKHEDEEV
jgi:elongation factor G